MDLQYAGKAALVTGGSRGIGREIAATLVAEGCAVAICARGAQQLDVVAEELAAAGGRVHAVAVDVTDPDALRAFVSGAERAFGRLDLVVHNASLLGARGPDMWEGSFRTDLMAFVTVAEAATEALVRTGGAIVAVATTSAADVAPPTGVRSYGPLKAAVVHHASALAHALAPRGVRVNVVSPGPIEFEGGGWARRRQEDPDYYASIRDRVPLGRLGTPAEVARAVAFLGSPAASFCNAANLVVDGGFLTRVDY